MIERRGGELTEHSPCRPAFRAASLRSKCNRKPLGLKGVRTSFNHGESIDAKGYPATCLQRSAEHRCGRGRIRGLTGPGDQVTEAVHVDRQPIG